MTALVRSHGQDLSFDHRYSQHGVLRPLEPKGTIIRELLPIHTPVRGKGMSAAVSTAHRPASAQKPAVRRRRESATGRELAKRCSVDSSSLRRFCDAWLDESTCRWKRVEPLSGRCALLNFVRPCSPYAADQTSRRGKPSAFLVRSACPAASWVRVRAVPARLSLWQKCKQLVSRRTTCSGRRCGAADPPHSRPE